MTEKNFIEMDPIILLSFVNTKLRDQYSSLNLLCEDLNIDLELLKEKLGDVGFEYDASANQFK